MNTGRTRFKKGATPWNKGKKCPPISEAKLGHGVSEETRCKISKNLSGDKNPNYGKPRSEDIVKRVADSNRGKIRSLEQRENISKSHLGKKLSLATIEKMRENRRGPKHWNWKNGITPLVKKIRNSEEYNTWRESVFMRDSYLCVIGGYKHGSKLNADHIKSFSSIMSDNNISSFEDALCCSLLWNIENGRTLCEQCHKKTETYGNRKR